jgi:AcrR family transcriptional regulator
VKTSTRVAILEAAAELIAERGYEGASVEDIAERAGVAKGSFFYNFGSKAAMYLELRSGALGALSVALRDASAGRSGQDALSAMVRALLLNIRDHAAVARVLAVDSLRFGTVLADGAAPMRAEAMAVFAEALRAAGIRPEDSMLRAGAVFGACLLAGTEWTVFEPNRTLEDVHAQVWPTVRGSLTP